MTQAERTRTIKYVLAESSRWLLHRRRDTKKINIPGCREKKEEKQNEKRKVGSKAQKQENRTQGVSIATNLPVSATKPRRGPCHTICHLPALVGNGIKCHCCRCRAPPPANKSTKTKQNCLDSGAVATQVPLISRTGTLPHDLPFHFCIRRQQYQYGCPSLSPPFPCHHSWRPLLRGVASCSPPRPCATSS